MAINELPDLAERIQVAMLNVMEERDIQIRGYVLRLPLDVLVVASANPEDYTNRGRIITPLKDRFGAEIRTHYPTELEAEIAVIRQEAELPGDLVEVPHFLVEILARFTRQLRESSSVDQRSGVSARFAIAGAEIRTHYPTELEAEIAVIRQEADLVAEVPDYLVEILARFTRQLRGSSAVDQRSGVSARFAIAGAETIAAAAIHRATVQREDEAVARVVDLETAVEVLGGKIEFETGEEGREDEILTHLLRTAVAETVRSHFRGLDFTLLVERIEAGAMVTTGEQVTARDFLTGLPVLGESDLYDQVCDRLGATNDGQRAGAIELALEGLYLSRKIGKDSDGSETVYG